MKYVCLNGNMIPAGTPVFMPDNRGYRYGDGLFETMKVMKDKIILGNYHFERLFWGLELLKFELPGNFTTGRIKELIFELCKQNNCEKISRVRLSVSRGNGSLHDDDTPMEYLIECRAVDGDLNKFDENGKVIDVYPDARKSCDIFSNLKSSNFLPYAMASKYARQNKLDDCLLLNTAGNICDATIANIFLVKNKTISTTPLSEGCVNGVMRKYLFEKIQPAAYKARETPATINDIENADEVFLTNTMYGIRWVKQFRNKTFSNTMASALYEQFVSPLLAQN